MEEQSSSGSAEWQVAEFVNNADEVGGRQAAPQIWPAFPWFFSLFESVDEFDGGEEPLRACGDVRWPGRRLPWPDASSPVPGPPTRTTLAIRN